MNEQKLVADGKELSIGDIVSARWTNSGAQFESRARVVRINKASVRVEVLDAENYLHGRTASIPLAKNIRRWSWDNGIILGRES